MNYKLYVYMKLKTQIYYLQNVIAFQSTKQHVILSILVTTCYIYVALTSFRIRTKLNITKNLIK